MATTSRDKNTNQHSNPNLFIFSNSSPFKNPYQDAEKIAVWRISLPLVFSFALEDHLSAYPQVFHAVLPRTAARQLGAQWRSAACVGEAFSKSLAGYFKGCRKTVSLIKRVVKLNFDSEFNCQILWVHDSHASKWNATYHIEVIFFEEHLDKQRLSDMEYKKIPQLQFQKKDYQVKSVGKPLRGQIQLFSNFSTSFGIMCVCSTYWLWKTTKPIFAWS